MNPYAKGNSALSGARCLVTGSAKRLGKAMALGFAGMGAHVVIHYRESRDEAEEAAAQARSMGVRAEILQADLEDPVQAEQLVNSAADKLDGLDVLVNNASIFDRQSFMDTDLETWNRNLAVNLTAPFVLSQRFAGIVQSDSGGSESHGSILNILDWRALRPGKQDFAYTIAKAGLAAMTRALAKVLAPGIRVNGIALGAILPPSRGDTSKFDSVAGQAPIARPGTVEEVVDTAAFLVAGPGFITGEIVHLDGGRNLV